MSANGAPTTAPLLVVLQGCRFGVVLAEDGSAVVDFLHESGAIMFRVQLNAGGLAELRRQLSGLTVARGMPGL